MPTINENVFIPVPPVGVFDFIQDPANSPSFQAAVTQARLDSDGPIGPGSRFSGTNKVLGRSFDWAAEVVEYERPTKLSIRSVQSKIDFTSTYTLTPEAEGTRLE